MTVAAVQFQAVAGIDRAGRMLEREHQKAVRPERARRQRSPRLRGRRNTRAYRPTRSGRRPRGLSRQILGQFGLRQRVVDLLLFRARQHPARQVHACQPARIGASDRPHRPVPQPASSTSRRFDRSRPESSIIAATSAGARYDRRFELRFEAGGKTVEGALDECRSMRAAARRGRCRPRACAARSGPQVLRRAILRES